MEAFRKRGFIGSDTIVTEWLSGYLQMRGEIACKGEIVIQVLKLLKVTHGIEGSQDAMIQTVYYAYNASVRRGGNIARVDNADHHSAHADRHHRHDFDLGNGEETLRWTGEAAWPTLSDFIDEIELWYWDHRDQLEHPESFPALGLREP